MRTRKQQRLAKWAGISTATISRMEACGREPVAASGKSLDAVLTALAKAGVELTEDGGVRPRKR